MERTEIISKLKEIFSMVVRNGVNVDKVDENANIMLDLGVNSVGMIYMAVAMEQVFGIDMSAVSMNTFKTVGDAINYVYEAKNK